MEDKIREQLRFKLFDARKHDLPVPNTPYPKDIEDHLTEEMDRLSEWLVEMYWNEHTS